MLRIAEFALGNGPAVLIGQPTPFGLRCELAWERPGATLMLPAPRHARQCDAFSLPTNRISCALPGCGGQNRPHGPPDYSTLRDPDEALPGDPADRLYSRHKLLI